MNPQRLFKALCLTCFITLLTLSAVAQDQPHRGTLTIPFDFYVGPTQMPAGSYEIEMISPSYVMLRSKDGKNQQSIYFMQVGQPTKNAKGKLVFATRAGKHYLAEAWGWFGKSQYTGFTPQPADTMVSVSVDTSQKPAKATSGSQ